MRRSILWAAVLVLVAVVAVQAQPPQRSQGGRRGPRGGGFFGGAGRGIGIDSLLRNDKVREELDLLEPQIEELKKLGESMRRNRPDFSRFRDMSADERRKAFEKMRAEGEKRAKEMEAKIKEILLPQQWERLQQIRVQLMGVRALLDREVQSKLKLSEQQVAKITEAFQQSRQKMGQLMQSMRGGNREGIREKFAALQKETEEAVLGILSSEQKESLEKLKGKKVDIQMRRFGRGGPPGRGGEGGRRKRGG